MKNMGGGDIAKRKVSFRICHVLFELEECCIEYRTNKVYFRNFYFPQILWKFLNFFLKVSRNSQEIPEILLKLLKFCENFNFSKNTWNSLSKHINVSGNSWISMKISQFLWKFLSFYKIFCKFLKFFENSQHYLNFFKLSGNFWNSLEIFENLWNFLKIFWNY